MSLEAEEDAFDLFNSDGSGNIGFDEFSALLDYIGIDANEKKQQKLFNRYDTSIQALYKKYAANKKYQDELKKDYLKIMHKDGIQFYYYNRKKKKRYYKLPKKMKNDIGVRIIKGKYFLEDELTEHQIILAKGECIDLNPGQPSDEHAIVLNDEFLHTEAYRRIDVTRQVIPEPLRDGDTTVARSRGELAYQIVQFSGARSVAKKKTYDSPDRKAKKKSKEEEEKEMDELLLDILNPNCRMCRLCERTGGFKPHAIHLFLCERCGHHKLLHGKRRTPMTKYEAALKIQKAWRIKAARKFLLNILSLQYEKHYDHPTNSYFYFNRRLQESQWHKPLLFGPDYDIALTGKGPEDFAPKAKITSTKPKERQPTRFDELQPGPPVSQEEIAAKLETMESEKEKKKYLKHVKKYERERKAKIKALEFEAAKFLQGKWRALIAKRQIRKSIHALYEKVWSAEHQRFFYYNVKNYKSQWSKPALLGPDDLTPRFYD